MVEGGGFEPPKLARQIYSLIPLATREPLRKAAHCPDGPPQCQPYTPIKLLTYADFDFGRCHRLALSPRAIADHRRKHGRYRVYRQQNRVETDWSEVPALTSYR